MNATPDLPKWYCWSGARRLLIASPCPSQAELELVRRAVEDGQVQQLGHFVRCNQRGFRGVSHTTIWTPQLLASLGVPDANRVKLRNDF
jgi:hypothetical protein